MGRDLLNNKGTKLIKAISIHAPVWGATHDNMYEVRYINKFQSTRPYGARLASPTC